MDHLEQLLHTLQTIEQTRGFLQRRCATGLAGQSLTLFDDLASLMELVKSQYGHTDYVPRYIPDYHHSTDVLEALAYLNQVEDWAAEVRRRIERRRLRRQLANQSPLEMAEAEGKPFVSTARQMAQMAQAAAPFAEAAKPLPPPKAAPPEERAAREDGVTVEISSRGHRLSEEEIRRLPQSQQVKYFYDLRRQETAAAQSTEDTLNASPTSPALPAEPYLTPGEAGARVADAAERAMATPAVTFSQNRLEARRAQREAQAAAALENRQTATLEGEAEPTASVSIPEATREHPPQGSSTLARKSVYHSGSDQTKVSPLEDTRSTVTRERPVRRRGTAAAPVSESTSTESPGERPGRPSRREAAVPPSPLSDRGSPAAGDNATRERPGRPSRREAAVPPSPLSDRIIPAAGDNATRERPGGPSRREAAVPPSPLSDRGSPAAGDNATRERPGRPSRREAAVPPSPLSDRGSPAAGDNATRERPGRPSRREAAVPPSPLSDRGSPAAGDNGARERPGGPSRRETAVPPSPLSDRIIPAAGDNATRERPGRPSRRGAAVPPSPLSDRGSPAAEDNAARERPGRPSRREAAVPPSPLSDRGSPAAPDESPKAQARPVQPAPHQPTNQPKAPASSRLTWETDHKFSLLMQQLRRLDPQDLYHQLVHKFAQLEPRYQIVIGDTLRKNPHLGAFSLENHQYEALERRAFQLCAFIGEWTQLYHCLGDMRSKSTLLALLDNWFSFNIRDASNVRDKLFAPYLDLDILGQQDNEVMVDCGAYVGDVSLAFAKTMRQYQHIFAFEPDPSSFSMLESHLSSYDNVTLSPKAVLDNQAGTLLLREGQPVMNRCSPDGSVEVKSTALDEEITRRITFLKIAVCGSESAVLRGAADHICKERPRLAVCADYAPDTLWQIPKQLEQICPGYRYFLRHYGGNLVPSQYVLYAVYPAL